MKTGDIVQKISGDMDLEKIGYILKVDVNIVGVKLVKVVVGTKVTHWAADLVKVISEAW